MNQYQVFHSTTYGDVLLTDLLTIIQEFLDEDPKSRYTLVIGSDSHDRTYEASGKRTLTLVTAIVVYRHGSGGKYFWKKSDVANIHTLRDKIYTETLSSLSLAQVFVPLLKIAMVDCPIDYNLEIHVDIGEHGVTRDMIKEVVGMVTGYGYVAKTKPYSFAASYVADKYT